MSKGWARTFLKNKNGAASFKIFNGFFNFVLVKKNKYAGLNKPEKHLQFCGG